VNAGSALGIAALIAVAAGAEPAPRTGISRAAWLAGCWQAVSPRRTVEESWMAPRGRSMIGVSRTVQGDSLAEYELVVLREQGAVLVYEAHPSGQPGAVFRSRELTDSSVVFENPAHDYPQRIGYRRVGTDSLLVWIDGAIGGRPRRVDFQYRRVGCAGP